MHPKIPVRLARAKLVAASLVVASSLVGTEAHAQAWLPDRAYTEGPGFRVGDLELHPGVAVRGGYDTNVFRADGDTRTQIQNGTPVNVTQKRQGAGILAVTPHLHLSTLSTQRLREGEDRAGNTSRAPIAFRGGLAATYYQYFLDNAPKNLEIDSDFALNVLPGRPFNIDLAAAYTRNVRPFTQNAYNKNAYNYDAVTPRLRFNFGSRSQVLTGYVGYAPRISYFESNVFNYLNNVTHSIEAGAGWKFLPSTALVYDANLDFQDYQHDDASRTRSPVLFANNKRFRTRAGLNGAITQKLIFRGLVGYAAVIFNGKYNGDRLQDHEDVVGEALFSYRFGRAQSSSFDLGYNRDLQNSYLGGWIRVDRGSATLRALLGGVFQLSLEGGLARVRYGSVYGFDRVGGTQVVGLGNNEDTRRKDIRVDGAIRGEYRLTNWLSLMADVSTQIVLTDFSYTVVTTAANPVPDPARYWTVMAFGGLRAHY